MVAVTEYSAITVTPVLTVCTLQCFTATSLNKNASGRATSILWAWLEMESLSYHVLSERCNDTAGTFLNPFPARVHAAPPNDEPDDETEMT